MILSNDSIRLCVTLKIFVGRTLLIKAHIRMWIEMSIYVEQVVQTSTRLRMFLPGQNLSEYACML